MSDSTKTTVYLVTADYERLKVLARAQGRPTADLVREAVAAYAVAQPLPRRPASIALGRSGGGDISERAEEFLPGMGE